jgi:hypothetical protein
LAKDERSMNAQVDLPASIAVPALDASETRAQLVTPPRAMGASPQRRVLVSLPIASILVIACIAAGQIIPFGFQSVLPFLEPF